MEEGLWASEISWLRRRHELLRRAISELEQHVEKPYLDESMNPDVPGSLSWANTELARVRARLDELLGEDSG